MPWLTRFDTIAPVNTNFNFCPAPQTDWYVRYAASWAEEIVQTATKCQDILPDFACRYYFAQCDPNGKFPFHLLYLVYIYIFLLIYPSYQ